MIRRLPRRVNLGRGYYIKVILATQKVLKELYDEDADMALDGLWMNSLGEGLGYAGIIYVNSNLSHRAKWDVYWHELVHAINDIMAWDRENPLLT